MKNLLAIVVAICVLALSGISVVELTLSKHEKPAIIYKTLPFVPEKESYRRGEGVTFNVEYCVRKRGPYFITQKLVRIDGNEKSIKEYILPTVIVTLSETGCRVAKTHPKVIPDNVVPGKYKFMWDGYSFGNYRNMIEYRYESVPFTVK